jgi:hypothetical protein
MFDKIDISDPHTFLAVKRGILQYAWVKPLLSVAAIIMKATGTYQEGYIGWTSGYFWSGIIYNVSITISLYALAMFWVCMSQDLQPFRPMPKFLCIKGIIFASYWQGFFLSILVWLGAIPDDVPGYNPDNLAAAIQDALICFEMPLFAIAHWYAFSWHDYADDTISAARLPVKYALRDAFGPLDLIQDTKEVFAGEHYEYRYFDARDNVLAHEESASRAARMAEGMRYERGGKGKYWIPKPGQSEHEPLLNKVTSSRARAMSPGPHRAIQGTGAKYGTNEDDFEDPALNDEDERLFGKARELEFGDWNVSLRTHKMLIRLTCSSIPSLKPTGHRAKIVYMASPLSLQRRLIATCCNQLKRTRRGERARSRTYKNLTTTRERIAVTLALVMASRRTQSRACPSLANSCGRNPHRQALPSLTRAN